MVMLSIAIPTCNRADLLDFLIKIHIKIHIKILIKEKRSFL
jgi:hypothetical protein